MDALVPTFLSLAFICLLAVVLLRFLGRRCQSQGRSRLRVIERLPLETRRSVYLIEAQGRCLLVGVADGGLSVLAELDPAEAHDPTYRPTMMVRRPSLGELMRRTLGLEAR